jgi:hypothetical protein
MKNQSINYPTASHTEILTPPYNSVRPHPSLRYQTPIEFASGGATYQQPRPEFQLKLVRKTQTGQSGCNCSSLSGCGIHLRAPCSSGVMNLAKRDEPNIFLRRSYHLDLKIVLNDYLRGPTVLLFVLLQGPQVIRPHVATFFRHV